MSSIVKKSKLIITVVLLIVSLLIPIYYTVRTPIYDERNTNIDSGKIVSTEVYELGQHKTGIYVFDNGSRYFIPNALSSYVDSFGFRNKGTELFLRYDPHVRLDNAYLIVSLNDNDETFLSVENTNRYERLSRILFWMIYSLGCFILVGCFWLGEIFRIVDFYKRKSKKKKETKKN